MDLVQKPRKKPKETQNSSSTPTTDPVGTLIRTSTNIAASYAIEAGLIIHKDGFAAPKASSANPASGEQAQQATADPGSSRGSRLDRWLARTALILDLTKSGADAGGLAPLKGACEGVVTLLGSIQVRSNYRFLFREFMRP